MKRFRLLEYLLAGIFVLVLVAVRYFQDVIFYDPLDVYFKGDFLIAPFPSMNTTFALFSNALRYLINTAIGIGILWMLFKSKSYIKASLWVYLFAFVLLNLVFVIMLQLDAPIAKMALFYTRRFIIHPLLLFVLVAGGYYVKSKKSIFKVD